MAKVTCFVGDTQVSANEFDRAVMRRLKGPTRHRQFRKWPQYKNVEFKDSDPDCPLCSSEEGYLAKNRRVDEHNLTWCVHCGGHIGWRANHDWPKPIDLSDDGEWVCDGFYSGDSNCPPMEFAPVSTNSVAFVNGQILPVQLPY